MKRILIFFLLLILFSCTNSRMKRKLMNFIGTEIIIPENLQVTIDGRDTFFLPGDARMKMIVWYDSVECASCQIKQIHEWENIVMYADSLKGVFDVMFIFSPRISDLSGVYTALLTSDFEYPVYIDNENSFLEMNSGIPPDKKMHTFLIDENNKVVLVGNPLYNEKLWKLYKEIIKK